MSIISLQVGQCGNQVGAQLFKTVYDDCYNSNSLTSQNESDFRQEAMETFFHTDSKGKFDSYSMARRYGD